MFVYVCAHAHACMFVYMHTLIIVSTNYILRFKNTSIMIITDHDNHHHCRQSVRTLTFDPLCYQAPHEVGTQLTPVEAAEVLNLAHNSCTSMSHSEWLQHVSKYVNNLFFLRPVNLHGHSREKHTLSAHNRR